MIDYEFVRVLHVIKSYGSFSKPILNSVISKFTWAEKAFISSVKYEYEHEQKKALSEIKKIKRCYDKNLKYLLMMKKLELCRILGKKESARTLYEKLRQSLPDISPIIRESIIDELVAYIALFGKESDSLGKFKLNDRSISDSAKIFFEMNIGRKLIRAGDKKGLDNFKDALEIARKIHHPPGIVSALNALSWYERNYDVDQALKYGKDALYNAGLYFEGANILYVFDTVLEVMNKVSDGALAEISRDFVQLYEKAPENIKKRYRGTRKCADNIIRNSIYTLDGKTKRFLRKMNKVYALDEIISRKQVYNILHLKVKNIRGETIRKIITKNPELFKEIELSKLPEGFICEMAKKKEGLQDGIDAMINERQTLDPFIQARKDLTKAYLERMPKRIRERFIQKYIAMDEEEKKIIDRFARDYVRYDIKWGMRVSVPDEMKDLIQSFHLKKRPASLSYWALDDEEERGKLVNVLKRFK